MRFLRTKSTGTSIGILALLTLAVLAFALLATGQQADAQSPRASAVTGFTVSAGDNVGELEASWDAHPDGADEYRLAWAKEGEGFKAWHDATGNAFPRRNR